MAKNLHVVPHEDGWAIKQEGEDKSISHYSSQREAIDRAEQMAQDQEVNLVIHRENGRIDHVENFTEGNGGADRRVRDDGRGPGSERVHLQDVASVGSRVSWGALMAGAVVSLTTYVALGTLGVAIGLSTAGSAVEGGQLYFGAAIWAAISLLVSLFLGGFVTSRSTVGENKTEAMSYGLLVWGTLFVAVVALTGIGLNLGVGGILEQAALPTPGLQLSEAQLREAGATQQVIDDLMEAQRQTNDGRATTAAWWAFVTIVVSIIAAVAGSLVGAGPAVSLEYLRQRRERVPSGSART